MACPSKSVFSWICMRYLFCIFDTMQIFANIENLDSNVTMAFKTHKKIFIQKKKKGCHFGSYGCCNKLSVTRWLETPEIYSLIFLTARSRKLVLLGQNIQSCLPFLLTGCHPVLASAASVLLASLACGQITTISASMASLPSLLFVFNLPLHFFYKGTYACV